jgi:hypothetical protein
MRFLLAWNVIPVLLVLLAITAGFSPERRCSSARSAPRQRWKGIGSSSTKRNDGGDKNNEPAAAAPPKSSYKFGDLTRGLLKKGQEKVNHITGKEDGEYQFGDLARHLDAKAKERILKSRSSSANHSSTITAGGAPVEKDSSVADGDDETRSYQYQLGDLSRWASHLVKEKAAHFSGQDTADDYQLGDVTKTILHRVRTGEYRVDDVYLALRLLVTAGIAIAPITNALPLKLLLQLIEADLAKDVAVRVTESVAMSLDARCKQALTGKSDYQLGDWTKDQLQRRVRQWTGKDEYEFGDIVRTLSSQTKERPQSAKPFSKLLLLQDDAGAEQQEVLDWDERFLQATSANGNSTTPPLRRD